jgi:flagellar assembly protein FliH
MSSSTDQRRFAPLTGAPVPDLHQQRQAARAIGYAEGWSSAQRVAAAQAEGLATVQERRLQAELDRSRCEVSVAVSALEAATRQLVGRTAPVLDDVADTLLEAVVVLARAVLAAELTTMDDVALAALRRALAPLPQEGVVTVRLNPADLDLSSSLEPTSAVGADATTLVDGRTVRLLADSSLRRGDAVAELDGAVVDARLESALNRALDVIRSGGGVS